MADFLRDPAFLSRFADDSAALQGAIDEARRSDGIVRVPRFNVRTGEALWRIARTVYIPGGVTLILEGARLRMEDGTFCAMFKNAHFGDKTLAGRERDIAIVGEGFATLDGGLYNGLSERNSGKGGLPSIHENHLIHFHNVSGVRIENLRLARQRHWAICFHYCSRGRVANLEFVSECNVPNQDGVDLRVGCNDFLIENLTGETGDDMVALTGLDHGFDHSLAVDGISPDIHDVTIRNVMGSGVGGCALVRLLNHDGVRLYHVLIDHVAERSPALPGEPTLAKNPDSDENLDSDGMFRVKHPVAPGERGYRLGACVRIGEAYWFSNRAAALGDTFGIRVRDVTTHARFAVAVTRTLCDSEISGVHLYGDGHMACYFGEGEVENVTVRDVVYEAGCRPHPDEAKIDVNWSDTHTEGFCAAYFHNTRARGLRFDGLLAGEGLDAVFAGSGDVELDAANIRLRDERTALLRGKGIRVRRAKTEEARL